MNVLGQAGAAYLQCALRGEELISTPMQRGCRIALIVPVMREPAQRVLALLESLATQRGMEPGAFEVLAILNRPKDDGTPLSKKTADANRLIMDLPIWRNRDVAAASHRLPSTVVARSRAIRDAVPVFLIDKSTDGRELADSNVGKARDRALAEAVHRFSRNSDDGLVIMTDADTCFHDPDHLSKALALFDSDPSMSAASGGVEFVIDPDAEEPSARSILTREFERLILWRRWKHLTDYLANRPPRYVPDGAFFGNHILFKAFAAAEAGGFPHAGAYEDARFRERLESLGAAQGWRIGDAGRALKVETALRESNRTWLSFMKDVLDRIGLDPLLVRDPLGDGLVELTPKLYAGCLERIDHDARGRRFISDMGNLCKVLYDDARVVQDT